MTQERAILAGGCFWGMEELFRSQPGVIDTTVGYTGGTTTNPTYEQTKSQDTGHAEAIEVIYDSTKTTYRKLLEFMFQIHDPTTVNRQGNDIGNTYRSAIFTLNDEQRQDAQKLITELGASGKWPAKIVTEVVPAGTFYTAEGYHQDYLQNKPNGYTCHYIRKDWKL